jgi:micrococcal nuclease
MKNLFMKTFLGAVIVVLVLLVVFFLGNKTILFEVVPSSDTFLVSRIIDGDTVVVSQDSVHTTIRLIGINTPETSSSYRKEECYGPESAKHMSSILPVGSRVTVETDPSQDVYDKYDRLLAYIMLGEINVNEKMIADGYAREYTYQTPYRYQHDFRSAERRARLTGLGIWGICK